MRNNCFDEGIIQAFFDGELKADLLEQVARHVSDCDACAVLMSDIESESAAVSMAFEAENFELVPTERLRTKIFAEIAEYETGPTSWFKKAVATLGFSNGFKWTSPSVAAFASLLLVVGIVGVALISKQAAVQDVASGPSAFSPAIAKITPSVVAPDTSGPDIEIPPAAIVRNASYTPARTVYKPEVKPAIANPNAPLQDERRYLQAIDTLKRSVDDRKDNMLTPSNLVSYERDMAVVDDAIKKMQKVARKNPKDENTKQLLLATYQNKIDLLSAVSDKTELMASLR